MLLSCDTKLPFATAGIAHIGRSLVAHDAIASSIESCVPGGLDRHNIHCHHAPKALGLQTANWPLL